MRASSPATRAARWSTRTARSSAWTPRRRPTTRSAARGTAASAAAAGGFGGSGRLRRLRIVGFLRVVRLVVDRDGTTTQGYAIPIDTALSIAKQIEAGQASSTVHIGATAFMGLEIASADGQTSGRGARGRPAGHPGRRGRPGQGDVITAINGTAVTTGTQISQVLIPLHPGDKVTVSWTDTSGQSHTATLTLGTGPSA